MEIKKKMPTRTAGLLAFVMILILWYLCSLGLDVSFLPSPITVLENIFFCFFSEEMYLHVFASLARIGVGILLSLLFGLVLGLSMGYFQKFDVLMSPFVYLLYPVPKIALLPLVMLICGMGEVAKVTMIVLIVVFQVIVAARDAVHAIPQENYSSLRVLGASHGVMFRRIVIPAALPGIFSSLRVSMGTALSVLFFTETFGARYGMGYYIMNAWTRVNYVDMFSGILLLAVLGFCLFGLIDVLYGLCCPWMPKEKEKRQRAA